MYFQAIDFPKDKSFPPSRDSWYKEIRSHWSQIVHSLPKSGEMLRLTKKADYSLIALKHFAARQRETGQAVSAKEVADSCGIPLPLLSKLLQKLGKTGFLVSEYGTNGGYRLARDPRLISALQVIRAIDGPIVLANCFTETAYCDHSSRCTVRRPLRRIHEAILRLLDSVSIQDLLQDSDEEPQGSVSSTLVALQGAPKFHEPEGSIRK